METQVSRRSGTLSTNIPVLLNVRTLSGDTDVPEEVTRAAQRQEPEVVAGPSNDNGVRRSNVVLNPLDFSAFEDPDKPLSVWDKIKLGGLLTFLYGMFVVAVILTHVHNKDR